jgi:hypothetical protein
MVKMNQAARRRVCGVGSVMPNVLKNAPARASRSCIYLRILAGNGVGFPVLVRVDGKVRASNEAGELQLAVRDFED